MQQREREGKEGDKGGRGVEEEEQGRGNGRKGGKSEGCKVRIKEDTYS